ncbi:phosphoribosylamine--glycine ligase [Piedraia hortae CBS 480.64]|uniref:phosphoribosylamine--glycine ligase n=1 Tax=Piedraia hortae CBS 480.64 TaxID=1314780 RepID=A0A6A7C015_9PEZI|nr:phosphoribosylamine--glycine ligase [Piedraia hortae CBS 480.64]
MPTTIPSDPPAPGSLRILLLGSGAREASLATSLSASPLVSEIHLAPGNGSSIPKCTNHPSLTESNFPALVAHAKHASLNLLLPGSEAALVAGITDYFTLHAPSILTFGPTASAARLEGSKTFSKHFMHKHNIPTAKWASFDDLAEAEAYLDSVDYDVVIKADGLAAGKGVIIPRGKDEAKVAVKQMLQAKAFGAAGERVVVEELLTGEEVSVLSLCDGEGIVSFPAAQDHKRIWEGDRGPNTGGMGTYAPTPFATGDVMGVVEREVLQPTLQGMKRDGSPFRGCLFTGLMLTDQGPRVLEYNVRFGDPETQSVLALLEGDFAKLVWECCVGGLGKGLRVLDQAACTVVIAAGGYPGVYAKGKRISIEEPKEEGVYVFHAGTKIDQDGRLVTNGGRVISVTARGETLERAVAKAYRAVKGIRFEGMQYRKDIAARALK